ncbi:MAG TPA: phosphotransferase [Myxococcota bacterium]|nr:phosphotransferase [Myxococcota bacterium]HPB49893.1 phosphotransferase [Myxococcota bacterium]HQP94968.1 phosphotransferase [Myxococcota bacterium]
MSDQADVLNVSSAFLSSVAGTGFAGYSVARLKGDASNRSYHRVTRLADGASWMVMKLAPEPLKSEEGQSASAVSGLPFSEVAAYLKQGGVAVPEIVFEDLERGFLILEDLGDVTLERALSTGGSRVELYQWAIDVLVDMQAFTTASPSPENIAFKRSFDTDLLIWEFEHFLEWGLVAQIGREPDTDDTVLLRRFFADVTSRLTGLRQGFVHRDFQSRNLMVKAGRMRVIDFQDALQGPFIYDLVALLRDSYVKFEPEEARYFVNYYREAGTGLLPDMPSLDELMTVFHLQALQRKLKDAGRFVYIDRVKHNPKFLPNIPQSLAYVSEAFDALPEYGDVRRVLARYLPEHFDR